MGIHSEAGLNRKFMEFAKLMNIYLNHFPKHEKYALANLIKEENTHDKNIKVPKGYKSIYNVLPC